MLLSYQRLSISCVVILLIFLFNTPIADQLDTKTSNQEFASLECCQDIRGNIDGDLNDEINISDISYMVEYMFGSPSGPEPVCFEEADIDVSGSINISDLVLLVNYMFKGGSAPVVCVFELNIDTKIQINMVEDTSGGVSKLVLKFATDSIYDCSNYEIGYSFTGSANVIDFYFEDIHLNSPSCSVGVAPASSSEYLGNLSNGIYTLNLNNGEPYSFQLIVTDSRYQLIGADERQFTIANAIIEKSQSNFVLNFDTEIRISMFVDTSSGFNNFGLNFVTLKWYGCAYYAIDYSYYLSGGEFNFHFNYAFLDHFICFTVVLPASSQQLLGYMPNGTYILNLDNGEPYPFQLVVTDTSYEIIGSDERQFTISNPILYKVP